MTDSVRTINEFLATVSKLRKEWKMKTFHELWFRAEDATHFDTRLQPGLYRPRRGHARKPVQRLLNLESDIYEEFGRCAGQLSPSDAEAIEDEWASYFLMQHYGAPTRLLDWSDGALISLHFAVSNKSSSSDSDSLIYILNPYWLMRKLDRHLDRKSALERWRKYWRKRRPKDSDEDDWDRLYLPFGADNPKEPLLNMPKVPLLWDSPHLTRRIAAQRSRFMIFGTDPEILAKFEKIRGSQLVSVRIPKSSIAAMRQEVRDAGITESVVFPDLDGLGRELRQQWEMER